MVAELLTVGAPDEITDYSFVHIQDGRNSPSPARVFLASARFTGGSCFRGGCGPAEGGYLGLSEIARRVGMSLCVVGASFCQSFSSAASAISGTLSLRRVLTAVQFGDMRPGMGSFGRLAANVMGAYLGCSSGDGLMIGRSRRVLASEGTKKLLLFSHKTRAGTQKARRLRLLLSRRSFAVLAWMCTCN